jgi:hypothetical protein
MRDVFTLHPFIDMTFVTFSLDEYAPEIKEVDTGSENDGTQVVIMFCISCI